MEERKKQTTRLLKAKCETCGYVCRVTAKWVDDVGPPHCPDHGAMTVEGVNETDPEEVPEKWEAELIVKPVEPERLSQAELKLKTRKARRAKLIDEAGERGLAAAREALRNAAVRRNKR